MFDIKKFIVIFLLLIMLSACKQQDSSVYKSSNDNSSDVLFNSFLLGKTYAVDKKGNAISIQEYSGKNLDSTKNLYAIYDMNNDDVPELIIKTVDTLDIFWIKNNKITLWYQGTNYTRPLNNMALLSERNGTAPEHVDYIYIILGYQGEEVFKIEFSKYLNNESHNVHYDDKYLINNTEVSERIYNSFTKPLLTMNDDKIIWKEFP